MQYVYRPVTIRPNEKRRKKLVKRDHASESVFRDASRSDQKVKNYNKRCTMAFISGFTMALVSGATGLITGNSSLYYVTALTFVAGSAGVAACLFGSNKRDMSVSCKKNIAEERKKSLSEIYGLAYERLLSYRDTPADAFDEKVDIAAQLAYPTTDEHFLKKGFQVNYLMN